MASLSALLLIKILFDECAIINRSSIHFKHESELFTDKRDTFFVSIFTIPGCSDITWH